MPAGVWKGVRRNVRGFGCRLPDAAAQVPAPLIAVQQGLGRDSARLLQEGKCTRQLVERTAHDLHVKRIERLGGQQSFHRLVLHVPAQVGASQASAQLALGLGGELLGWMLVRATTVTTQRISCGLCLRCEYRRSASIVCRTAAGHWRSSTLRGHSATAIRACS